MSTSIVFISFLSIVACVLLLALITYSQKYIESEGVKSGMSPEEISKWKLKALLYGAVFGLLLFRREIQKRQKSQN